MVHPALAYFGGQLGTDLIDIVDVLAHPEALEHGWWVLAAHFEGAITGYRFGQVRTAPLPDPRGSWRGPRPRDWVTSLDRRRYVAGVAAIRESIAAGQVYQVNLCRMLTAPLPSDADPVALAHRLAAVNPAAFAGLLATGDGEWVVTASPELFLRRAGDVVTSGPVKGTAGPGEPFAAKDFPENIMITDLVRNDLGRVARPGSVRVTELAGAHDLPGLRHLVSTISAQLRPGVGWAELLAATLPPGSVSGAPKHTALQSISALESVPRGLYCGVIGVIDADSGCAELAVGIRTFFTEAGPDRPAQQLNFGTGAGITWASDPEAEWAETELKAARLVAAASS